MGHVPGRREYLEIWVRNQRIYHEVLYAYIVLYR